MIKLLSIGACRLKTNARLKRSGWQKNVAYRVAMAYLKLKEDRERYSSARQEITLNKLNKKQ